MLAYHNDSALKASIIAELEEHARQDRLIKGIYWKGEHLQFPRVGDTAYRLQEVKEGEAP